MKGNEERIGQTRPIWAKAGHLTLPQPQPGNDFTPCMAIEGELETIESPYPEPDAKHERLRLVVRA